MNKDVIKRHQVLIVCLLLISASLIVYWPVLHHDYINFDDGDYVYENPRVQSGLTIDSIVWAFTQSHSANWHPITWLSHMLDVELYGLNPSGHHWTNLQIHIANSVLLFLLFSSMTGAIWRSGLIAALFALHPVHVESVAWIAERKDVLSTFFWMLTSWAYIRYVRRPSISRYGIMFLLYAAGLMSKPMLVTLPFVFLLIDFWPLSRYEEESYRYRRYPVYRLAGRLILEKVPLFFLSAMSSIVTFFVQKDAGAVLPKEMFPLLLRISNACVAYIHYLAKLIWPGGLAVFYPHPETLPLYQVVGASIALVSLTVIAFLKWKNYPYLIVGWLWYLGTLVPVIGLVQVGLQGMANRYLYIPAIGIYTLVIWSAAKIIEGRKQRRIIISLCVLSTLLSLMIGTRQQVRNWKDSITIFSHAIEVAHNNFMAHFSIARPLMRQKKTDEAIYHYVKGLQIKADYAPAYCGLGIALTKKGEIEGAIYHYNFAIQLDPNYDTPHYNLARLYDNQRKLDLAIHHYERTLGIKPKKTVALYHLSWILATSGNEIYRNGPRAVILADRLCQLTQFKEPLALDALAAAYAETGRWEDAVSTAKKGLELSYQKGPPQLIVGLRNRLKLYQGEQPYRE